MGHYTVTVWMHGGHVREAISSSPPVQQVPTQVAVISSGSCSVSSNGRSIVEANDGVAPSLVPTPPPSWGLWGMTRPCPCSQPDSTPDAARPSTSRTSALLAEKLAVAQSAQGLSQQERILIGRRTSEGPSLGLLIP